ncbi:MAG: TonB-dependent receptor [Moraxellaceae bacterium]|jgi:iron complex outermembrane receptor protein|nr:TonB-dependent receptor [Moraxellaceae bacterium]
MLSLALVLSGGATAAPSDEEDLTLAYGDQPTVTIATGRQQALSRAPAVATVITARDIEAMGATELDQVLESVAGLHVSVSSFAYTPIYSIRGIFTAYNPHVLMLVNGLPVTTAFLGNRGAGWGGLPLENVARVEVIRGPGSALYGAEAFSGVINVVTKTADEARGTELGVRAGSFRSRDAWVQHGSRHGELATAVYLRSGRTDGQKRIIESDLQTLINPSISLAPGPLSLSREAVDARADVSFREWRLRSAYQEREVGAGTGLAESLDPYSRFPTTRFYVDLTYRSASLAPNWDVSADLDFFDVREKPSDTPFMLFPPGANFGLGAFPDGVLGNPGRAERHGHAGVSAFYTGLARHQMRIGSGYRLEDLYRTTEVKNFRLAPAPQPLPGGMVDVTGTPDIYLTPHRRELTYVFAQDEWTLAEDWVLTTGLRYDHYSDFGDTTNPRLALVWNPAYNLVIKALHGRAFRAPSFTEQFSINNPVTIGNPGLQPETIATSELAFSWQPTSTVQSSLSLFEYDMRDIIRFTPNAVPSTGATAQNVGRQTGHGLELEGSWAATRELRLTGHLSLQRSIDEATGQDAGLAPRQRVFVRSDWRFAPRWQCGSAVNHVADRRRQPGDARRPVDDYTTLDVSLRREKLFGHADISVQLQNLFDSDAREPSLAPGNIPNDLPLPGRTFHVQLQYRH